MSKKAPSAKPSGTTKGGKGTAHPNVGKPGGMPKKMNGGGKGPGKVANHAVGGKSLNFP